MAESKLNASRYAVLGTGALGGLYGGLLAHSGCDVHFLLRSDFSHVKAHGLRVDTPLGNFHLANPNIYQQVRDMPPVDIVLVCWKSTQNSLLKDALSSICGPGTCVLVLQNGWEVEQTAAGIVGEEKVLGGCCFLCSNKVGPGHIHHLDFGRIAFGEYSPRLTGQITERMLQIAADFAKAGVEIQPEPNLRNVRWRKLMWNIPYNGLSVVLQADTRQIMDDPQACLLVEELMNEVRNSARACGYDIEPSFVEKLMNDTRKMVPYDSSMLLDYRHQREMEIEAIFGNPLRAAISHGYLPTKIEVLYRQLSFLNRRLTTVGSRPSTQNILASI
jgi:2-dehydropantoate 2-reductase